MQYYSTDTIIHLNGRFVKAEEAFMDYYSQSLHYGYAVFEGIRSYKTTSGATAVFKALEHYDRLKASAAALNLPFHWESEDLMTITDELLALNNLQDAYIRPLVFAPANMKFDKNKTSGLVIEAWPMEPFLGEKLLRVMSSSWQRPNPKAFPMEAKASGLYVNSILASQEAKSKGFDEALLTDINRHIAEGPGANMFFEKDGKLVTPPAGFILPGITRATVIEICSESGIQVDQRHFGLEELKQADAAFFCGTAAEIVGWASIDEQPFRKEWNDSLGKKIQQIYQQRVREWPQEDRRQRSAASVTSN